MLVSKNPASQLSAKVCEIVRFLLYSLFNQMQDSTQLNDSLPLISLNFRLCKQEKLVPESLV